MARSVNKKKGQIPATKSKIGNTVELLSQKNLTMSVKSKRRSVFEAWRDIARKRRAFAVLVAGALQKSLYSIGFEKIKAQYKENWLDDRTKKLLKKYTQRLLQTQTRQAINTWKHHTFQIVTRRYQQSSEQYLSTVQTFDDRVERIKGQNTENCLKFFRKKRV